MRERGRDEKIESQSRDEKSRSAHQKKREETNAIASSLHTLTGNGKLLHSFDARELFYSHHTP